MFTVQTVHSETLAAVDEIKINSSSCQKCEPRTFKFFFYSNWNWNIFHFLNWFLILSHRQFHIRVRIFDKTKLNYEFANQLEFQVNFSPHHLSIECRFWCKFSTHTHTQPMTITFFLLLCNMLLFSLQISTF